MTQHTHHYFRYLTGGLLCLLFALHVQAMPARPDNETLLTQPDGTQFKATFFGDEWLNWGKADNGKIFIFNTQSKQAEFAKTSAVENRTVLVPTGVSIHDPWGEWKLKLQGITPVHQQQIDELWKVHQPPAPAGSTKPVTNPSIKPSIKPAESTALDQPQYGPLAFPTVGTNPRVLVLLTQFADYSFTSSFASWRTKVFATTSGYTNHYFNETTYGTYQLAPANESWSEANDGIVRVTLSYNHPHPAGGSPSVKRQIVIDAINAANSNVNFASFDTNGNGRVERSELQILVVTAGPESSYGSPIGVWAHAGSVSTGTQPLVDGVRVGESYAMMGERHGDHDATIGVIAHELGHSHFLLPDLYWGDGIGTWGLMGVGSWGTHSGHSGNSPSHFNAWSKIKIGVVDPIIPELNNVNQLVTMHRATDSRYRPVMLMTDDRLEYFLLENRYFSGYDRGPFDNDSSGFFPNGGLAIWHIKENGSPVVQLEWPHGAQRSPQQSSLWAVGYTKDNFTPLSNETSSTSHKRDGADSGIYVTHISGPGASMTALVKREDGIPPAYPPSVDSVNTGLISTPLGIFARIEGTASDPDGYVAHVQLRIVGETGWINAEGAETWWRNYSGLAAGTYQVYARATDNTGLVSGVVGPYNLIIPTSAVPPTVDSWDISLAGTALTAVGTASDGDGNLSSVQVRIDGSSGTWTNATGTSSWSYSQTLTVGPHTLEIRALDSTGLMSTPIGPLTFSVTEPSACVTDNNPAHVSAGRAVTCGFFGMEACAVGSGDNLGWNFVSTTTSLEETSSGYWELVPGC